MEKKLKVSIVVLNWNGKKDTLECLETLRELRIKNYELRIIVVDNGSTDGSVEAFKQFINHQPSIINHLIANNQNLGFTGGNNVGVKYALEDGADYVIVLNNDTLVDKNLVEELLKVAQTDEQIGIVAPKIYFARGYEYHKDRYKEEEKGKVIWYAGAEIDWRNMLGKHRGVDKVDVGPYDQVSETDYACGCCMFFRREVFGKIGFFDERYFMYLEDMDLSIRAKIAGFKLVYAPAAVLWHKNAQSSDKPGSVLQNYYITRNQLLFGLTYAPLRTKLALFRQSLRYLLGGGEKRKAVVDFYLGKFGRHNL